MGRLTFLLKDERAQSTSEYAMITAVVILPLVSLAYSVFHALGQRGAGWVGTVIDAVMTEADLLKAMDIFKELTRY